MLSWLRYPKNDSWPPLSWYRWTYNRTLLGLGKLWPPPLSAVSPWYTGPFWQFWCSGDSWRLSIVPPCDQCPYHRGLGTGCCNFFFPSPPLVLDKTPPLPSLTHLTPHPSHSPLERQPSSAHPGSVHYNIMTRSIVLYDTVPQSFFTSMKSKVHVLIGYLFVHYRGYVRVLDRR